MTSENEFKNKFLKATDCYFISTRTQKLKMFDEIKSYHFWRRKSYCRRLSQSA
jgi:hypothetical protein